MSDVDAACHDNAQKVSDTAAEVTAFGPIPEVIRPLSAAWNGYLSDILDVRVPDGGDLESVQAIRRDINAARVALVQYMQEYESAWPRVMSGEMSSAEASSLQQPHWTEFQETSIAALSELRILGATNCGV